MSTILPGIRYLEGSDINADGSLKPYVCQGKPVVMMLQGNFCGYCTKAKPDFLDFARRARNCSCCTVQIDGGPGDKLANKYISSVYKGQGVPAYLGFDANGQFVTAHNGGRDADSLQAFADSL
jgi:hypothetical protein